VVVLSCFVRPALAAVLAVLFWAGPAAAGTLFVLTDSSGLSAEVEFTLIDPTTLEVRARNTSTGVPVGFSNSDQLLTGISWDFGHPGFNGDAMITGGTVLTGPSSASVNFDITNVGANADVSGEWTYGNMDGTGLLTNFISASISGPGTTVFGGANLDGPVDPDGPQGGLVADPILVPLGGLGAIQDEIVATLSLDMAVADLSFLTENGVRVEFGSDAFFITVPEPATAGMVALGLLGLLAAPRRR
jgi:hypothetical protein